MPDMKRKLYAIAENQQGYFTARQAREAGFSYAAQSYHVQTSAWIRVHRGIYRLAMYPETEEGQYVLWSLWSCDRQGEPQGVYSHQTALSLHELSDLMPRKLHMTVPRSFRRMAEYPPILVLHRGGISAAEIEHRPGYKVVRPLQAIENLLRNQTLSRDRLAAALREGLSRGLITSLELRQSSHAKRLQDLLGES